jgi:Tol biopolymer transport system component/C-terminal processing protease CtpA/Prc
MLAALAFGQVATKPYFSEPHLSPDRREIAFVSGGDIWRVEASGGNASLLVAHAAEESRPLFSPDGKHLAFVSTRTGSGDIYILDLTTAAVRRITFDDGLDQLDSWSRDGAWLYFHTSSRDISGMNDVYRVPAQGGTPAPVAADRYASEFFAAPSPDGKTIVLNARGVASRQWWRKGHSHLDMSEILLLKPGPSPSYERISDGGAKEIWPMWAADGKSVFFVSDRTGVENIWRQPIGGTSRQVSQFKDGRVLWPTLSYDGKWLVFERDFGIWRMDANNGKTTQVPIALRGASAGPDLAHVTLNTFDELALSPDGKKLALIGRGEVFAAPAAKGGQAQAVTRNHAHEQQVGWAPDSLRIVYVSDRNGPYNVFLYDFRERKEQQLTATGESDAIPRFSPDGKRIAFTRGGKGIWVYDLDTKQERKIADAETGRQPLVSPTALAWSPDSRQIAFVSRGSKGFSNVFVAAVDAAEAFARPVSFLANGSARTICWHSDGKAIYFLTSQRTEPVQLARIDLIPRVPKFREDELRGLFQPAPPAGEKKEEAPAPPVPAIQFEGIRERLALLRTGLDVKEFTIAPDGKSLLLTAASAGQENLYTFSLDELATEPAVARQLTSTSGAKSDAQWAATGKEAFYLEKGRIQTISLDTRQPRAIAVTAEMDTDFDQLKKEVFHQAWSYTRDHFFDEKYNGVDWTAQRMRFEPIVNGARTPAELYRLLNLMHGDLNASHMGVSGPSPDPSTTGNLGLRFDPTALEANGQHVVIEVIPQSPAALAGIVTSDVLTAIDGVAITRHRSYSQSLQHRKDKRVELSITNADGQSRTVVVRPISNADEKNLLYRAWVEDRRAYVDKISAGRLGYVHMPDMSDRSLDRLHIDLDTENHSKEGVIIDVRNNNGGFVNAYALDVFTRKGYLTFVERGRAAAPARSLLGQRSLELPTILVTNQHSLSDAEDFTEGYRRLRIGKVVGEPTSGWIVYTWNQTLIDGSTLRMPRTKVFDNDGVLMEMHPRPVDIPVDRPVGESYSGKDVQLETATRELLQQIESTRPRPVPVPAQPPTDAAQAPPLTAQPRAGLK